MPMALTLSSMPLTSLALLAPTPVIWVIWSCTLPTDSCPTAATATSSTSMQPNPRLSRLEIDRDLRVEAADMGVLGYRKDQSVIKRGLWCKSNNGAHRPRGARWVGPRSVQCRQ